MDDFSEEVEVKNLEPRAIFGFDGKVEFGIIVHPDKKHIVYPIGSKIAIATLTSNTQDFMSGHTNTISCLDVSESGKYVGSGQESIMGFQAYTILWDWKTKKEITRHNLHKVKVESLTFTAEDKFLISLGCIDDGAIIVFDIEAKSPISRATASSSTSGHPHQICRVNIHNNIFFSLGDHHIKIWSVLREDKKLVGYDIPTARTKRVFTAGRIDNENRDMYLGTMTGDIIKVRIKCCNPTSIVDSAFMQGCFGWLNPKKEEGLDCEKYIHGVRNLYILETNKLLVGAGDGTIHMVEEKNKIYKNYQGPTTPNLRVLQKGKVNGAVTSISKLKDDEFLIGTENSEMYLLKLKTFKLTLIRTCHKSKVYDVVFPKGFSLVFATCGYESVRIWSNVRLQELLRIVVYNFHCASIKFSDDGYSLITAWNDGVLRAFTPITGKLIWAIPNAHNKGCSAVTISSTGRTIVSGGIEGQVRVWKIEPFRQSLIGVLKEHTAPISTLDFSKFDNEVVSASQDGSCIIWDINRLTRKHVFYATTQFMAARYYPSAVQIITTGSNHMISYYEVYDGSLVRDIEGSTSSINCLSINPTGEYFVSGDANQVAKVWDYKRGIALCSGSYHATPIVCCHYSPCGKYFVTGSTDGSVIIWDIPKEFWPKNINPLSPEAIKKGTKGVDTKRQLGSTPKEKIGDVEKQKTKKDVLLTECPKVNMQKQIDVNEICNCLPDELIAPVILKKS